jgi:tyrosyl-tRNA synthetase
MDVDLEVGGNDQMFNMMCGRDLLRVLKNKEKFVLTMKLLADESGKKMGKTEGNVVFLNETANDIYGKVMSWPDGTIVSAFELCTNVPTDEVKKIEAELKGGKTNPRDYKMKLAHEITRINRGQEAADKAQENFVNTIQKKEVPAEMETYAAKKAKNLLVDLLVETKLAKSKTEARQKIEEGAIKIKAENEAEMSVIKDVKHEIDLDASAVIIQKGKFNFVRVTL